MLNTFDFHWHAARLLWLLTLWCCISLNHTDAQKYYVSTPTSATVCDGKTTTLICDICQSNGTTPLWRIFTTSNTSGSPVVSLNSGENKPPYNYPTVQAGDTAARLEVTASSSIDGYHFQCRLSTIPPTDSPGTGTITVIKSDIPSCPNHVEFDSSTLGINDCDVSLTWEQPPNTPPVTSTTVTYCPTSSPNCGNSMNCTSPCTLKGLLNDTEYQFTVIPNNNCGSPTGCTGNTMTRNHVSCQGTAGETTTSFTPTSTTTTLITPISPFSDTSASVFQRVNLSTVLVLFCLVALFL